MVEFPSAAFLSGYGSTSSTSRVAIMATTYTEQLTNAQRSISSSSASDTLAGTGAQIVRITYYDQTMSGPNTEDINMNGTSTVNTVNNNICFIEKIEVIQVGSGGNNAGTISLFISTAGAGGTIGTIAVNDNKTNWCHHYIGTGLTMMIWQFMCGNQGSSNGNLTILKTSPAVSGMPDNVIIPQIIVPTGMTEDIRLQVPLRVAGPARIIMQIKQSAASGTNNWFAGLGYQEV